MAASLEFKHVSPFPAPRPKPSVTLIPPQLRIEVGLRPTMKTAAVA
jgi:hypothetical protein